MTHRQTRKFGPLRRLSAKEDTCYPCVTAEHIRDEKTAHQIKAIPDMLEALEEVKSELDAYVPTCPLCGGSAASGHKYNCLWHIVNAAIKKARGEE